jgi:hypothetical protein
MAGREESRARQQLDRTPTKVTLLTVNGSGTDAARHGAEG